MKQLRQYIRGILSEVYKLTPAEDELRQSSYSNQSAARRALGLQTSTEIIEDRDELQKYQDRLKSTEEGRELIRRFMNGKDVTIMHSIIYSGYASSRGFKSSAHTRVDDEMPFQRWIGKFGRKGKDVISCVASDQPLGMDFLIGDDNPGVAHSFGFIMKGYPVYISEMDVMSQTLGAIPAGLVKHQEQSGVAKRPGDASAGKIDLDFGWAGEVLLDNWTIIGTYMDISRNNDLSVFTTLAKDSMIMFKPVPFYVYDDGYLVGKITDKESMIEVRDKLFGF